AGRRSSSVAIADAEWEYDVLLTYPQSDEEIVNDLVATGLLPEESMAAVQKTSDLAALCTVELPKAKPLRFKGDGRSPEKQLKTRLHSGWLDRVSQRGDSLTTRQPEY